MSNFEFQLFGKFILLSMSIDDNRWAAFVSGGPAVGLGYPCVFQKSWIPSGTHQPTAAFFL